MDTTRIIPTQKLLSAADLISIDAHMRTHMSLIEHCFAIRKSHHLNS
jgi:hypothetical protein